MLFTHHFRMVDEASGALMGAISDLQVARVRELVTEAGNAFEYLSFPEMGHSMHGQDPQRYVDTLSEWVRGLPSLILDRQRLSGRRRRGAASAH